jgi:hypothetical protein
VLPWTNREIDPIVELVQRRLEARGLTFQRFLLLGIAIERAYVALAELAPTLFPLITEAEVALQSVRSLPPGAVTTRQSSYYEVVGVVDVLTSMRLPPGASTDPIQDAVAQALAGDTYEVIVDYKGMRRPSINDPDDQSWLHHERQLQTYAWLRRQQANAGSVRSGILMYLNELVPSAEDMNALHKEVVSSGPESTDVLPTGTDLEAVRAWPAERSRWQRAIEPWQASIRQWWTEERGQGGAFPRMPLPRYPLSLEYRRRRALRFIAISERSVEESLDEFDHLVGEIEESVAAEVAGRPIPQVWPQRPREATCTVCDFRRFCPAAGNAYRGAPQAP